MFLKLVAIVCLVGLSTSGVNAACNSLGGKSNVKCVTKTEFLLAFQDDDDPMRNKCPPGTVCADYPNICVSDSLKADCANEVVDGGACDDCRERKDNDPVCISQTEYALCRNKEVDKSRTYQCAGFCKADFDTVNEVFKSICSVKPRDFPDCPNTATTTTAALTTTTPTTTTPTTTTPTTTTPITTTPTTTTPITTTPITTTPTTPAPTTTTPTTTTPTTTTPTTTTPTMTTPTTTTPITTTPITTTPTTTTPTTTTPTTTTSTTTAVPGTRCTAEGYYPDTSAADCQKYIKCTKGEGDAFISQSLSCTGGFNFNAATKRCVPQLSYPCPGSPSPSPTVPGTRCTAEGFYPDTSVPNCRNYMKCTKGTGETFVSETYSCADGFSFNATTKRCVPKSSYQCPAA